MSKPSKTNTMNHLGKLAQDIQVALFRQIHHLPLVWQGKKAFLTPDIAGELEKNGWCEIQDPLRAMAKNREKPDPDTFNEVVYFHDFARNFLYPRGRKRSFHLFEKCNPGEITASFANEGDTHDFTIERLTLHVFRTKTAILTVETLHKTDKTPITLAQVQTIIDHFRRLYTPYWINGKPAMVPIKLRLSDGKMAIEQKQEDMIAFLEKNRDTCADAPLLEPWKSWIHPLAAQDWRIPSDERVPVMSFILLEKTESTNRDTLNQIRESDWYRLAEANESGQANDYNPGFLKQNDRGFFYDRFMPDAAMPDGVAARHIFGGAHYSVVLVDGPDRFARDVLQAHFRRHYEKLALTARFEFASLLAFSSRITKAVKPLEGDNTSAKTRNRFRKEILTIHEEFLEFTHRYRFTGISSQIQAGEMFDRWRASLDLDRLYQGVKDEITSASEYAMAAQADRKATDANALAWVAILAGALVSAPALNEFVLFQTLNQLITAKLVGWGFIGAEPLVTFFMPVLSVVVIGKLLFQWLRTRERQA